jgi:peptide/nickel transport system substrate-binding protein
MKTKRINGLIAVTAASALVLSGCATGATDIVEGSSVTIAWNEGFYSANSSTTNGNNVVNANVAYLANSSFNYYDSETNLIKNEQFGKYELLNTEPVTVKYTVNSGVKWSDGAEVNASDMLLAWAANSCNFNNIEPVLDEDTGEVTNQDELDAGVFFDSAACGTDIGYVTQTPVISDGGRSITLIYDEPVIDWELAFGIGVPAHVTTQVAFPGEELTDEAAQQKLIDAINNNDLAVLAPISKAWSTAYDMVNTPENMDLLVSNGAYTVTELVEQEYVTLTANPAYSWGPSPKVQKITIRIIADPKAAVQSLANGEVDVIAPQATADILLDLATYKDRGIVVDVRDEAAYEHIDLTFNREGGPFNPATYGGGEEGAAKAQKVRAAFLMTIPREDIIEKLIAPINPNAVLMNSLTQLPSFAWYDDIVAENGSEKLAFDIEGAKALLAEAGVSTPVRVEMMFNGSNPRRVSQFTLIQESAALAGFNVVDESVPTGWGGILGSGTYDATLFAWGFTSTSFVGSKGQFTTEGAGNYSGYSNAEVDALYEKLSVELDPEVQKSLLLEVEKLLWADAFGTTVFQFPSVVAYNSNKIKGVVQAPLVPGVFWNFWEWEAVSEVVEG